jgi:hypothetical protein
MQIYRYMGYQDRDAVKLILEKNLYGLDIDRRAYQLAYFALMMKARQYDRRALLAGISDGANSTLKPTPYSLTPTPYPLIPNVYHPAGWSDGEEYGSLVKVDSDQWAVDSMPTEPENPTMFDSYERDLRVWNFKRLLAQKYDVVVTNPPYMGGSGMSGKLSEFVKREYPDSKSDLFAAFIERGLAMIKPSGYSCMVTMQSWMFLSSFENMRKKILSERTIINLLHMENMVMGIAFGTAVTNLYGRHITDYKGRYNYITMKDIEGDKPAVFPTAHKRNCAANSSNFAKIPGSPVAYWVNAKFLDTFMQFPLLGDISYPKQGLATSDNDRYLRLWSEVSLDNIEFQCESIEQSFVIPIVWYPYCKGGEFRKWYGNREYVINWQSNGQDLKANPKSVLRNPDTYFRSGMSYSDVSAGDFGLRYYGKGFVYDSCGPMMFSTNKCSDENLLGVLNSVVINTLYKIVCPTMHFTQSSVAKAPIAILTDANVSELVKQNISLSRADWDAFETSWDFKRHPLVCNGEFEEVNRNDF